ncbi:IucA/IucC family siderophore biosynthesis protein [Acinetobacter albensis]|uniref:IucA/IucC family protein n=1 Tax=Acinetobacter albensis TaxID=1673609 RepID=UPI001880B071|nr:IucA/IucC family protein [Acinetobacter albensis]MBE9402139.1 IucA/IucC family siderophore biosynthesis protein [Acinetobacter albensis]
MGSLNHHAHIITLDTWQHNTWLTPLQTNIFQKVEQRVIRQLLQTMLFEHLFEFEQVTTADQKTLFTIHIKNNENQQLRYECMGKIYQSFDLIRLDKNCAVQRVTDNGSENATLQHVIQELILNLPDALHVDSFIHELQQTLLKDTQVRSLCGQQILSSTERHYDALESYLLDAHTYHPCYKSRIGFNLQDNFRFSPEFKQDIQLIWLAIVKSDLALNVSKKLNYPEFIQQQIGQEQYQTFQDLLILQGKTPDDYCIFPVHPWQWDNEICSLFTSELAQQKIILLGQSAERYRAQQSIRSLANHTDCHKPYVKLSLGITNTSSKRTLSCHTVLNAPLISDWLQHLIQSDSTAQQLDFEILAETVGIGYADAALTVQQQQTNYGALGVIWRESIHQYLREDEDAFPLNGFSYLEPNQQPIIASWVEKYGLEAWLKQLIQVTTLPVIHMLFAEGIGMESHAQNIILIHKNGWPVRVALKDFHDGVRYSVQHLSRAELAPQLVSMPEHHAKKNDNSHVITTDPDAVRDITCDCFFFICLADFAIFLNQQYHYSEQSFWKLVADCIHAYQLQHPQHQTRFKLFDVFTAQIQVEELTKRRLFGDAQPRFKYVNNPLARFAQTHQAAGNEF